jgi:hypothetical protein
LVVPGWVEGELADQFAGVAVGDADVQVVDEHQDWGAGQSGADADVVESAAVAQGDRAVVVDPVGPDSVVGADDGTGRYGLGSGGVGVGGGAAVQGTVRPDGVVVGAEAVQLALQLGDRGGGGLGGEPLLQGLMEALDLAASLGVVGAGVGDPDAAEAALHFEGNPALASWFGGEDGAVEFLIDVKPPWS